MVGGFGDSSNLGATWVFIQNSTGDWVQQGNKLVGSNATAGAQQGWSVSLSYDGNTALLGGVGNNADFGATWVFTRSGGVWSQQGNYLTASDATSDSFQGSSVSLSSDGNTALIGAAWVYVTSTSVPTTKHPKTGHPTTRYPSKSPRPKPTKTPTTRYPSKSPSRKPTKTPTTRYPSKSPSRKPAKK